MDQRRQVLWQENVILQNKLLQSCGRRRYCSVKGKSLLKHLWRYMSASRPTTVGAGNMGAAHPPPIFYYDKDLSGTYIFPIVMSFHHKNRKYTKSYTHHPSNNPITLDFFCTIWTLLQKFPLEILLHPNLRRTCCFDLGTSFVILNQSFNTDTFRIIIIFRI